MSTPICLDESITSPEKAQKAFEVEACKVINIKEGRLGGIENSLKVMNIVKAFKGHVWIGGMLETGIGRAFNVSVASLEDINYPGDTSPNDKYFTHDIVKNPFNMINGTIKPNEGNGIGAENYFRETIANSPENFCLLSPHYLYLYSFITPVQGILDFFEGYINVVHAERDTNICIASGFAHVFV